MNTCRPDDDPTHALDDFVRRMKPGAAPAAPAMPDLSALDATLGAALHAERGADNPAGLASRPRAGRRWQPSDVQDVEDIAGQRAANRDDAPALDLGALHARRATPADAALPEVQMPAVNLAAETAQASLMPAIDLPAVDAPLPTDLQALDITLRRAGDDAAQQWRADAQAAAAPAWQPDLQALQLRPASHPRLVPAWQPGAWVGALRQVMDSRTEFVSHAGPGAARAAPVVESYPPQWLLLLWPPQRIDQPLLGRWPQQVRLTALPREQAVLAMLAGVPEEAPLWLQPDGQQVDWALAAEIALHHEPALRPFQTEGLREFIAAEREATFARLNQAYAPAGGFAVRQG